MPEGEHGAVCGGCGGDEERKAGSERRRARRFFREAELKERRGEAAVSAVEEQVDAEIGRASCRERVYCTV